MKRGVAQLASALAWGARGRKFESSHPDNITKRWCIVLTRSMMKIMLFFYFQHGEMFGENCIFAPSKKCIHKK